MRATAQHAPRTPSLHLARLAHACAAPVQYDRSKSLRPRRNIRMAMQHEIMLYALAQARLFTTPTLAHAPRLLASNLLSVALPLQKEGLGFDKAVEECKYRMSRYSVTPNVRFGVDPHTTPFCRTHAFFSHNYFRPCARGRC